ncbi:MAG: hypothetical protein ACOYN5_06780 [Bacteroidales bacterium]|jgi:uncharacterized protein YqgV (UPF0045/DUF77 family)
MKISVDISYYPLQDEFVPAIHDFIARLNQYPEIEVLTNGMSTQVFGEYDQLMPILTREMKVSCEIPHSIFVLKIVNSDRSHYHGL